jgi:putative nucleotidyltransferase with HDIG domain
MRYAVSDPPRLKTLAEVCRSISDISTLPNIALRIVELASNPDSDTRDITAVMETDPSLSTRVLRSVNSAAYGLRNKVSSLSQAIAYLGMKQIRNLAVTASVSQVFQKDEHIGSYDRKRLWKHLVAVGICARLLAMRQRLTDFEDVFLAGLLHDIGLILEDQHVHEPFKAVVLALRAGDDLLSCEQQHLGFDHTRLGEAMAVTWKLPDCISDAIRHHHDAAAYQGKFPPVVQCVEVANFICSLKGLSAAGINLVRFPRAAIVARSLTKEDLLVLAGDLDKELAANSTLFQV